MLLWCVQISLAAAAGMPCDVNSTDFGWKHAGPGGYRELNVTDTPASAGAAQAMVQLNGTAYLLATANGGIWHSGDILAVGGPHWTPALDGQPVTCTSISAMESHGHTVVAGCGSATSAEMGVDWMAFNSGDWGGVMISLDGGASWKMTAFPPNYFITAMVVSSPTSFVVAARAHFLDRDDGGVWATKDGGATWTRTLHRPVYDLVLEPGSKALLAALPYTADEESVYVSLSGGYADDFTSAGAGLFWDGRSAYYPTFALGGGQVFVGALTANPAALGDTSSALFTRPVGELLSGGAGWARVLGDRRLERDGMPKDRMALLVQVCLPPDSLRT